MESNCSRMNHRAHQRILWDLCLIVLLCLLALQPLTLHALDVWQLEERNCSAALNIPIQRRHQTMGTEAAPGESAECPLWFHRGSEGAGCEAGPQLGGIVWQNMATLQTYLPQCNCMTQHNGTLAVGACLYTCNATTGSFPLPCDVTDLNNFTCAGLNREGQLCGQCIEGHAPPVYSYDLKCVECKDYQYNWLKYLAVAFLPLTVFFCVVTVSSISFTSPLLSGVVLMYQLAANPIQMRLIVSFSYAGFLAVPESTIALACSFIGIWNLDFFRLVYEPFCLHPNMTALQVLALEYAIAVYPLLLIVLTYMMVSLHDNNFKPVVWLWKPFRWLLKHFKQQWNVRTSLIDVFASFIFLSTSRLLTASFNVLVPTYVYFYHNETATHPTMKHYLLNAPTVEYFGREHLPIALLALTVLVLLVVLPMLLLFLYPLRCFQRLLNRFHLNSHVLRTFMDVFQGTFKDGTNGTRDYRSFSGFLLLNGIVIFTTFSLTLSNVYYPVASIFILLYCVLFIVFQPYKNPCHNYITIAMGIAILCSYLGVITNIAVLHVDGVREMFPYANQGAKKIYLNVAGVIMWTGAVIPLMYLLGLVSVVIYKGMACRRILLDVARKAHCIQ